MKEASNGIDFADMRPLDKQIIYSSVTNREYINQSNACFFLLYPRCSSL